MSHVFGGEHTERKLDVVEDYLKRYTSALSTKPFTLWYIDAFAGTGSRDVERDVGLFDETDDPTVRQTLDGSARRALKIDPPFQHFVFVEEDAERVATLENIRSEFPDRDVTIKCGEANEALADFDFLKTWSRVNPLNRGVVFLDPYALQVDWATLVSLAQTRKIDVWYLFPIRDVTRQLAHDIDGVGPKSGRLDRVLGHAWRELYAPPPANQSSLFDAPVIPSHKRIATKAEIEDWFRRRLESEFSFVADPVPIGGRDDSPIFSLFLAIGNKSERAKRLAGQFAKDVRRRHEQRASRRMSGR